MMPRYPEHEKLSQVKELSQVCGEFLLWLRVEKGAELGRPHVHGEECYEEHDCEREDHRCSLFVNLAGECRMEREKICGFVEDQFHPIGVKVKDLLAEFFEIDQEELELEKREMLEELRSAQEGGA